VWCIEVLLRDVVLLGALDSLEHVVLGVQVVAHPLEGATREEAYLLAFLEE
jgi:hypothetical protein